MLDPVDRVELTVLADAYSDIGLPGGPFVQRMLLEDAPRAATEWFESPGWIDWPTAEPGYSVLVKVWKGPWSATILYDAGATLDGVRHNMRRVGVNPSDIDLIVLSHGHFDHTAGMQSLVAAIGRTNLPVIVHPDAWRRRRLAFPGRDAVELPAPSRRAYEDAGLELRESAVPSFVLEQSVLVTGEVDRRAQAEAAGNPIHEYWDGTHWLGDPHIHDDQAIVLNLRGAGLIVVTACGHAGLLNIIWGAQALAEEERIHAVVGGFHLSGPLFEPRIAPTVEELRALAPEAIVPGHCTGPAAHRALAEALPEAYSMSSVGSRVLLRAANPEAPG